MGCGPSSSPGPDTGQSAPHPGRRVADVAADVAAILDALGGGHGSSPGGRSGGGPHALACAAAAAGPLPGRGLASPASALPRTPTAWTGWRAWAPENVAEFGAAERGPAALTAFLDREDAAALATVTGADSRRAALGGLIVEPRTRPCSPGSSPTHHRRGRRGPR